MSNKFYQVGEQRAARVGDLFGVIAPSYDLINDLQSLRLHRHWKKVLVKMSGAQPGMKALDLCCGTGDIAFLLEQAGADVTGVDFSPAMLAVAQERRLYLPTAAAVSFQPGDALHLPFASESFDIVTIGYGLRNLEDWQGGLAEMFRVSRRGGRLLVLDFGKPPGSAWRAVYFAYLKHIAPVFGALFCRDRATYGYIYESLRDYPAQRGVAAYLAELGCREVRLRNFLGGAMSIHCALK